MGPVADDRRDLGGAVALALEGEDAGGDAIEEAAVVGDDEGAARVREQGLFEPSGRPQARPWGVARQGYGAPFVDEVGHGFAAPPAWAGRRRVSRPPPLGHPATTSERNRPLASG